MPDEQPTTSAPVEPDAGPAEADVPSGEPEGGSGEPEGGPAEADAPPPRPRRSDRSGRRRRRRGRRGAPTTGPREPVVRPRGRRARRRASRTAARRRRARIRALVGVLLLAVVAVGVVIAASGSVDRVRELVTPDPPPPAEPASVNPQPTVVVVTHDEADPDGRATGLMVLAAERETGRGTVLLVPTATVTDVPGSGSFQLAEARAFGGAALAAASLENLMEVRFDTVVGLSEQGWSALLTRVGGFEVEVRSRLVAEAPDGGGEVRFEPGPQFLDGPRLAELLGFRAPGETELEALPRTQQVVVGMLRAMGARPEALEEVFADGAPMLGTADVDLVREVFELLVAAEADDRLSVVTLPVTTLGTGREDLYRPDSGRIAALVDDRFSPSRPVEAAGSGRSVQILNGNGVPGIGQLVAEALRDGGYRVLLTGNADRFTYETTRIIVYDDTDASLAVARDVRARLGVGEVERSGTPQTVVDVTIVVGHDFPPAG